MAIAAAWVDLLSKDGQCRSRSPRAGESSDEPLRAKDGTPFPRSGSQGWHFVTRRQRRLNRQFEMVAQTVPAMSGAIDWLLAPQRRIIRVPIACSLILGGFLWFLPILGLWMLPLGLLLLAVDIPGLQPFVTSMIVRIRRLIRPWFRRLRG